jgi:RimJ/RimL family protein N-acetyltransferase
MDSLKFNELKRLDLMDTDNTIVLKVLERSHLEEFTKWPLFKEQEYKWANFIPQNKMQKDRWYADNSTEVKLWYTIFKFGDEIKHSIGRVSLIIPQNGNDVIFGIVIHPYFLNQGYGSLATKIVLKAIFAKITNCRGVWLETYFSNERAMYVYKKIGFKYLGYVYHKGLTTMNQDLFYTFIFPKDDSRNLPDIKFIEKEE